MLSKESDWNVIKGGDLIKLYSLWIIFGQFPFTLCSTGGVEGEIVIQEQS